MATKCSLPPPINDQLNYLLSHSPLPIKVGQVWSGGKCNPQSLDRFTLFVPYCLDYLKWDFVYNAECPMSAPDVIFGPEDDDFFPFSPVIVEGGNGIRFAKSSLCDWNGGDPARLLNLVLELRKEYLSYQMKCVGEINDDRVKFELSTILSKEGMEMQMSGAEKAVEVKFAVPLTEVDINKMMRGCPWRHQQKIYLQVVYPVGRKYASAPSAPHLKLVSSPELKAVFSIDDVKLPKWLDGTCLAEYLPNLEVSIERQLIEAVTLIDARRRFIEALAPSFGKPVEADPVFCTKAAFLASSGTFTFLVQVFLSAQFPKQQPSLMLQSCQHFNTKYIPIKSALITDIPWSPRWNSADMAERTRDFVREEATKFKRYCTEAKNFSSAATVL